MKTEEEVRKRIGECMTGGEKALALIEQSPPEADPDPQVLAASVACEVAVAVLLWVLGAGSDEDNERAREASKVFAGAIIAKQDREDENDG